MTLRTLNDLASACGALLEGDGALEIRGPAGLRDARPDEVSFCASARFRPDFERTRAGAVLVPRDMAVARKDLALLRCENPSRAFTAIVRLFAPPRPAAPRGVHPSAVVDASAELGADVSIGPLCHVGPLARIGARTILRAHVAIGEGASVGTDCELHPGVVLYDRVQVGARCIVHAGAVLGADGHGFEPRPEGWVKIPQCGTVLVEDDVEIGANATIDRARFGATKIGRGSKLDNLVHIGHNVIVGEGSMILAQVGISGSTRLGRGVVLGGHTGVAGHIDLGDGVRAGGMSAVIGNWPAGSEIWGYPAREHKETLRAMAHAARAEELSKRVRELERRLEERESHR